MKQEYQKEIELAFDKSLKRARSQYSWVIGARKALEKEDREKRAADTSFVKNTGVENTRVQNTEVKNTRVGNTGVKFTGVESTEVLSTKVDLTRPDFPGYLVADKMDEAISKFLQPSAEILYRKLYRWSWGNNRNYCRTSYASLAKKTNIKSTRTIREAIHQLLEKHFIRRLAEESMNSPKGTVYLIHIPQLNREGNLTFIDNDTLVDNSRVEISGV